MLTGWIRRAEIFQETGFMAEPRLNKGTFTWAPRALAVISCALALLAAQPAVGAGPALRSRAVVLGDAGIVTGGEAAARVTVARATRGTSQTVRREETLLGSARHLHILATMEILHRLLAGELRTAERQALPEMWFEQVCLGVAEVPLMRIGGGVESSAESVPIVERAFAIRHCLLAPPLS
jgi:hypothetical protein